MAKKAMSVTLDESNVLWLRGRARLSPGNNVSETLDRLVTEARLGKDALSRPWPSIVGTIDLGDDPDLLKADEVVREYWNEWFAQPFLVHEERPVKPARKRKAKARG